MIIILWFSCGREDNSE